MVRLAGRPILGHILHSLAETRIDEVAIVVGESMQQQIISYATESFSERFDFSFPEQPSPEGLGHSVYQAVDVVGDDPALIALGDMIFTRGYERFLKAYDRYDGTAGSIGTKRVEEPQHYGIVETDADGRIETLVEKPADPPSNQAISGVYVIRETRALFEALGYLIENDIRGAGDEYQLTDALDRMVQEGATLQTFAVTDWYDCGRPETLLEANRVLLDSQQQSTDIDNESAVVVPPVDLSDGVEIERSVVGPHVSIDAESTIVDSRVRDSIVGQDSRIENANLTSSIVGDSSTVVGTSRELNVGDSSELSL